MTSRPARTSAASAATLRRAALTNSSTWPECSHGAPQHLVPAGRRALDPVVLVHLHDGAADVRLHVLHEAGREHRGGPASLRRGRPDAPRFWNHVVNRCLA